MDTKTRSAIQEVLSHLRAIANIVEQQIEPNQSSEIKRICGIARGKTEDMAAWMIYISVVVDQTINTEEAQP